MITRLFSGPFALRVFIVTLLLSLALGWSVWDQVQTLRHGTEIILKTRPIDPRSLFRGHYARLDYAVSWINKFKFAAAGADIKKRDRIQVRLKPGPDGFWQVAEASTGRLKPADGSVILNGRVKSNRSSRVLVKYGIERYFAPKDKALGLEKKFRNRKVPIGVIVRVAPHGGVAISGLMLEGKKIYDEPLF